MITGLVLASLLLSAPAFADEPDDDAPQGRVQADGANPEDNGRAGVRGLPEMEPMSRKRKRANTVNDLTPGASDAGSSGGVSDSAVPAHLKGTKWFAFPSFNALVAANGKGTGQGLAPLYTPKTGYAVGFETGNKQSIRCVIVASPASPVDDGLCTWHLWISRQDSESPIEGCYHTVGATMDRTLAVNIYGASHRMHNKRKGKTCSLPANSKYYCRFTAQFGEGAKKCGGMFPPTGL